MLTKPMLAGKCTDIHKLRFPVLATPKIDGIRCLIILQNGQRRAVSRNFKPIPNHHVREWLEENCPVGYDGELIVPEGTFQQTSSAIMSRTGKPDFTYLVFDLVTDIGMGYDERMWNLEHEPTREHVDLVLPLEMQYPGQLEGFEQQCLRDGYEGVMVRSPDGRYKCGRSTEREGLLLKIKRFVDGEAVIFGVEELMHNANPAELDELGRTKRSSHKANQHPRGMLGALLVFDRETGVKFRIGTGFDEQSRRELWKMAVSLPGKIVKYKYQSTGVKEAPRFPVFLGFRSSLE